MTDAELVSAISEARTFMARLPLARELRSRLAEITRLRAELAEERAKPKAPERGPGWSDHGG